MKALLLITALSGLFFKPAFAQGKALLDALKKAETSAEIQDLLKKAKTLCKGESILDRFIKEGFEQTYFSLDITKTLVLLTHKQQIAVLLVEEDDKIDVLQYWPERVLPLFEAREKLGIKVSNHQFLKEISRRHVFALNCGDMNTSNFGPEASAMYKAVYNRDVKPLKALLGNFNLEMQAYGVMGLLELKHMKVDLEASLLEYVYDLLEYNPKIMVCQGCMFGIPISLKELVFQRP